MGIHESCPEPVIAVKLIKSPNDSSDTIGLVQGGHNRNEIDEQRPNMPVKLKNSSDKKSQILSFEPSENDEVGEYEYEFQYYYCPLNPEAYVAT